MKFNIGDKLHISGDIEITGEQSHNNGSYSYNTNLGVAFPAYVLEQLTAASVKPQDKPKFKAGDKAKVIGNSGNPRHFFEVGQIVNIGEVHQRYNGEWCARCTRRDGEQNINFCDLEPYAEPAAPAKEPVKLYCVKSYEPGHWCTKGKIYEIDANGSITHDCGWIEQDFLPFMRSGGRIHGEGTEWAKYLVPLVSRPAKAGEWVYIAKSPYSSAISDGAVLRVVNSKDRYVDVKGDIDTHPSDGYLWHVLHGDYLVLDGYDGRHEPQEPKYYSGKVVCVKKANDFLTAGKVYTFQNGTSISDSGDTFPCLGHIRSLENLNEVLWSDFIEYKGEAT